MFDSPMKPAHPALANMENANMKTKNSAKPSNTVHAAIREGLTLATAVDAARGALSAFLWSLVADAIAAAEGDEETAITAFSESLKAAKAAETKAQGVKSWLQVPGSRTFDARMSAVLAVIEKGYGPDEFDTLGAAQAAADADAVKAGTKKAKDAKALPSLPAHVAKAMDRLTKSLGGSGWTDEAADAAAAALNAATAAITAARKAADAEAEAAPLPLPTRKAPAQRMARA